jgi:hypothetical protein
VPGFFCLLSFRHDIRHRTTCVPARRRRSGSAAGRVHEIDNLYLADGSVFTSSGGFNPTLTIMALALRTARAIAGEAAKVK